MSGINFSRLLGQSGNLLQHLARAYGHRSQLAALETIEARNQLAKLGLLALGALVLGALAVFMLGLVIAALVWPLENRVQILSLITGGLLLLGFASAIIAWRRLQTWSPWSETRRQLHEDCVCLGEIITDAGTEAET